MMAIKKKENGILLWRRVASFKPQGDSGKSVFIPQIFVAFVPVICQALCWALGTNSVEGMILASVLKISVSESVVGQHPHCLRMC